MSSAWSCVVVYVCLSVSIWLLIFRRTVLGHSLALHVAEFEELSGLLKEKGINASDPGRVLDPVEAKKERLLARDEERKKKQTERHVLTKAMVNHPIPRLFVSRRNDKNPNGFNCAICRKDVSFLSREPGGTWRHSKCKGHYLKDRRYRLDHEDVIYSENLDAIPVAEVSAELRAEIELTPLSLSAE